MARLVVHSGLPTQWEIALKPGENLIGRSITNHFQINDPSVSSSHCRITLNDGHAQISDLGSTNGTFVNGARVQQHTLQSECALQLGDVRLTFYPDLPIPCEPVHGIPATRPRETGIVQKPISNQLAIIGNTETLKPSHHCKFHPAMAARYQCPKCNHYFCDACVATRSGGAHEKFCRRCGTGVVPVEVQYEEIIEKSFAEYLPGAFVYPVRGTGIIIVAVGMALAGMIKWGEALFLYGSVRAIIFGCILEMFAGGYLFTYLQGIVHSTTAGDRELPDLPGISNFLEDVILPFFKVLGFSVFYFLPALITGIWALRTHEPMAVWAFVGAGVFACLFYPMAFLAVAIHDSITAANPLLVVPSIARVPGKYLVAVLALVVAGAVQWSGGLALERFFPEQWTTHAMGEFIGMIGFIAFVSFLTMYLLIIGLHLLGLIFVTSKDELGWLKGA